MRKLAGLLLAVLLLCTWSAPGHCAWDAIKPADLQKIRLGPKDIRDNNDALEDALAREHEFPGTLGTTAGRHAFGVGTTAERDAITSWQQGSLWINISGALPAMQVQTAAAAPFAWSSVGEFPSGTRALFFQATCPSGWTKVTTADINDRVVRIVTGATGGAQGGTWTVSGLSTAVANHTLSVSEMPAHAHNMWNASIKYGSGTGCYPLGDHGRSAGTVGFETAVEPMQNAGGGGGHNHTATTTSAGTWRPAFNDCIACQKD